MKKRRIKYSFIGFTAVIILLLVSIPLMAVHMLTNAYDNQIRYDTRQTSLSIQQAVQFFMDGAYHLSYELALNPGIATMDGEVQQPILVDAAARNEYIELFFITGMDGMQTARSEGPLGDRSERWWFRQITEQRQPFVSHSYISVYTHMPCTSVFIPMYDDSGSEMVGIFGADISLGYLQGLVEEFNEFENGRYSFVIDSEGFVIAHHDSYYLETHTSYNNIIETVMDGKNDLEVVNECETTYYVSHKPIILPGHSEPWYIITLQSRDAAMTVISRLTVQVLVVIGLIIIVLIALIAVFYRLLQNSMNENESQLLQMNLMVKATKIGLWNMGVAKDDPYGHGNTFTWSDDFRHMLGYNDENDFPNVLSSWVDCICPKDKDRVMELFERHIADKSGKTPYDVEYYMYKKNGEAAYYRDTGETIRDANGNAIRVAGALLDITATKNLLGEMVSQRMEAELQLVQLNLAITAAHMGLWDMEINIDDPVNPSNKIAWSDEFRKLLGYQDEHDFPNLISSFHNCLHPDDLEWVPKALSDHILDRTGKTPFNVEYRVIKKGGECAYIHAAGETIRDENGTPLRVVGTIMDATEAKNLVDEIECKRREAVAANNAKSTFLSTMSHEIRTPMNAIIGLAEIQIHSESLDADVLDAFEKIYAAGDTLLSIINDILDLSKVESGKMEILVDSYEIASLLSDSAQLNMMRIGSKQINFELLADENTPTRLLGDELRVKQIVNNLLSNAFKYTDEGTVTLEVTAEPKDEKSAVLVITVKDTGSGMTKEQVSMLFDEYTRFNLEANRATEGTGLGMNITQKLVKAMGGSISVESEPGKGSSFTVRLPQGRVSSDVLGRDMAENLRYFRTSSKAQMRRVQISRDPMPYGSVLIVDDVEMNIHVAKGLLTPYKLKLDSANSGVAAIEKIKDGNVYDIIFMDHMMPQMDGIEATAHLREMGYKHPIVALTANAVAGQADIFLQNGFDDYLSKPVDIRQMNMVLNKLIRDRHPPETVEAAKKSAAAEKEDKAVSARESKFAGPFLRDAKKAAGVLEPFVKNGGSYSESEMKTYSICIHGMKSALAYIGNQGLSDTAFRLEQLAMKGDAAAIASETPAFIAALKEYVRELESEAGNNLHGQAGARLLGKNIAGLDIAKGIERNNGDGNVYLMLLRTYAANVRLMLKSVESVSEDSLPDYKIIVHGIKGVSYAICAERVGKMAEGLESASGSGDFAYVSAHNEPFIEEAMRLVRDLEELICGIDAENPKPKKDKPDTELLLALLESCRNFDLDGADAAMAEIEKYQYDSDGGLVKWLRENVDLTNLDEIEQKLQDTEG